MKTMSFGHEVMRKRLALVATAGIAALLLAACGGGGDGGGAAGSAPPATGGTPPPPAAPETRYTVSATAGRGGQISAAPDDPVAEGSVLEFVLTPLPGFMVEDVSGCDGALFGERFETAPLAADCDITATFMVDSYAQAHRFLTRTTFGPNPAEVEALLDLGEDRFSLWIDEQISVPQSSHHQLVIDWLLGPGGQGYFEKLGDPELHVELIAGMAREDAWFQIAVDGPDALRQRVAFALSQIMVISEEENRTGSIPLGMADYYDTLARYAFGNFRDLLEAVTLHPAMGSYLSMMGNRRALPGTTLRPDENFAREVMQLFTIGLDLLEADGTTRVDESGHPLPTYGQENVSGFARALTGWHFACVDNVTTQLLSDCNFEWLPYDYPTFETLATGLPHSRRLPMVLYPDYHEPGEKQLLDYPGVELAGGLIPAGVGGEESLRLALDNLFHHPNVGPFIGRQLIQRLVTSNPSPGYVRRVAEAFDDDGAGVRGNLEAVIRAILLDEEALQPDPDNLAEGKLKEPLLAAIQLWRTFEAFRPNTVQSGDYSDFIVQSFCCPVWGHNPAHIFGQAPLRSLSVFNFFSPFYSPPGEISNAGLVAPEAQLATEGLFGVQSWFYHVTTHHRTTQSLGAQGDDVMHLDISEELAFIDQPEALLDHVAVKLLGHSRLSPRFREAALELIAAHPAGSWRQISEAIYLVSTSPQYAIH